MSTNEESTDLAPDDEILPSVRRYITMKDSNEKLEEEPIKKTDKGPYEKVVKETCDIFADDDDYNKGKGYVVGGPGCCCGSDPHREDYFTRYNREKHVDGGALNGVRVKILGQIGRNTEVMSDVYSVCKADVERERQLIHQAIDGIASSPDPTNPTVTNQITPLFVKVFKDSQKFHNDKDLKEILKVIKTDPPYVKDRKMYIGGYSMMYQKIHEAMLSIHESKSE